MKYNSKRFFWIACMVVIMILIFYLSSQSSDESYKLSEHISQMIGSDATENRDNILKSNPNAKAEDIGINYLLLGINTRKIAHVFLYFSLSIFTYLSLSGTKCRGLTCFAIDVIYACTDEIHQHLIGRTGSVTDVLIDSLGILAALLMFFLFSRIKKL